MKKELAPEIEKGRVAGKPGDGPLGAFKLLHPQTGRRLTIIASDGRDWELEKLPGEPWGHVSVSCEFGTPRWAEMCWAKDVFFEPEDCVVEYHPPKSSYVNCHPNCLHLWQSSNGFPMPPRECV